MGIWGDGWVSGLSRWESRVMGVWGAEMVTCEVIGRGMRGCLEQGDGSLD